MRHTNRTSFTAFLTRLGALLMAASTGAAQAPPAVPPQGPDRSIVPASLRDALLDEISGERALAHVQILAVNRDRQPQEYLDTYFETAYIRDRLTNRPHPMCGRLPSLETRSGKRRGRRSLDDGPVRRRCRASHGAPAALARGSSSGDVEPK